MTDLDRLRKISAAASTGLPPPTNEERRFLLKHLEAAFHQLGNWLPTDNAKQSYHEWRDACRYTVPPKRCPVCDGEGKKRGSKKVAMGTWRFIDEDCPTCRGTGYLPRCPKCNGWGLYGGEQCAECKGSECQETVT